MSNGTKKSKPHRVIQKVNVDRLYEMICGDYGFVFNPKIKEERYNHVLKLAKNQSISKDSIEHFLKVEGEVVFGSLHSAFSLPEVPRVIYEVYGFIGNFDCMGYKLVFIPNGPNVQILVRAADTYDYELLASVERRAEVCLVVRSQAELPYDMRQWSRDLYSAYFNAKAANVRGINVSDSTRTKKILGWDLSVRENLVKIRKINFSPSKPQRKKIEAEVSKVKAKMVKTGGLGSLDAIAAYDGPPISPRDRGRPSYQVNVVPSNQSYYRGSAKPARKSQLIASQLAAPSQVEYKYAVPLNEPAYQLVVDSVAPLMAPALSQEYSLEADPQPLVDSVDFYDDTVAPEPEHE